MKKKNNPNFNPEDHLIFDGITGSRLYGTHTELSDIDFRGVCIPPMEVLLNPFMNFNQKDSGFKEEDRVIYSLGQFFKLCADGNPNIVEFLFIPEKNTILKTKEWDMVLTNKHLFLSKVVRHRFAGYAAAQIKRVKSHRKWFINPPKEKPTRKMFGLKDSPDVSLAWLNAIKTTHNLKLIDEKYKPEFKKEQDYRTAKQAWDNYVSWRDSRNPVRKKLEEKWGFDCKFASHIYRLISEGKELLLTGNITFPLLEADKVMDIKNGKYEYEEVLSMIDVMDEQFDSWYKESMLPKSANRNTLTNLYFDIINNR